MKYLDQLCTELQMEKALHQSTIYNYAIPKAWDIFDYQEGIELKDYQVIVNPYDFYHHAISSILKTHPEEHYLQPISKRKNHQSNEGSWIKGAVVYSTMIRTTTAWDHDRDGEIKSEDLYGLRETGTFLKSIILLPFYKQMGINTMYLLPVSLTSKENRKGEFGSPYAVSNFFKLDPLLQDPLCPNLSVEDQFKAFIEACHMLDIHVVIDIIPRTNAIHSQFIKEHPEWFYWIKSKDKENYKPPVVPTLCKLAVPNKDSLNDLYKSEDVWRHIEMFNFDPKTKDIENYDSMMRNINEDDVLNKIEEHYHLCIAPAFSDQINDPQPAWSDVTYFRLFLDHPIHAKEYVDNKIPPYILNDTIKSNWHPGTLPNSELWDLICDIIPFYQREYGIDGVRIDMGHALPIELVDLIIKKARIYDPNICIIAEELDPKNAIESKKKGYNMILGNGFTEEVRIYDYRLQSFVYELPHLVIPCFACGETHDTPRIAQREGKEILSKLLTLMNLFLPNAVPFINSGQEFYEAQPMNTGLDCGKDSALALDPKDPRFGKLALFDPFYFDYIKENFHELPNLLKAIKPWREEYLNEIVDLTRYVPVWFDSPQIYALGYTFYKEDRALMMVANTNVHESAYLHIHIENLIDRLPFEIHHLQQVFSSCDQENHEVMLDEHNHITLAFALGEVKLIELYK